MLLIDDHISGHGRGSFSIFSNEEQLSRHWIHELFAVAAEHGHTHIIQSFIDLGSDLEQFS